MCAWKCVFFFCVFFFFCGQKREFRMLCYYQWKLLQIAPDLNFKPQISHFFFWTPFDTGSFVSYKETFTHVHLHTCIKRNILCKYARVQTYLHRHVSRELSLPFSHVHECSGASTFLRSDRAEIERTQNSELYYSRIEILGICLFLQSVLANLHANTYTTTLSTLTTMIEWWRWQWQYTDDNANQKSMWEAWC